MFYSQKIVSALHLPNIMHSNAGEIQRQMTEKWDDFWRCIVEGKSQQV